MGVAPRDIEFLSKDVLEPLEKWASENIAHAHNEMLVRGMGDKDLFLRWGIYRRLRVPVSLITSFC